MYRVLPRMGGRLGIPPRHCVAPLYVIEQILSPTNSSLLKFVPFLPQVFGKPRGELYQVYDRLIHNDKTMLLML